MTTLNLKSCKSTVLLLFFFFLINGISAAPIVVTTTNPTGVGSLGEAITTANGTPGYDTIQFNIAGVGPHVINFGTVWTSPTAISNGGGLLIDGFSQPGASGCTVMIQVRGTGGGNWEAWNINTANNVTIRGLSITHTAVVINGGGNNKIYGCYFDIGPDGTLYNDNGTNSLMITNSSTNNIIGGVGCGYRNVFGGVTGVGVFITNTSTDNRIVGNYFGTDFTGNNTLGQFSSNGIEVYNSQNNLIDSNTVVNCLGHGIYINTGNCSGTIIRSNNVGVGANGLRGAGSLGNGNSGIIFNTDNTTSNVTISSNIVSGNGKSLGTTDDVEKGCGIFIRQPGVDFLRINNNIVGVDKDYQLSGNNYAGIYVRSGSDSVTISGNIVGDNGLRGGAAQKSHGIALEDRTGIPVTQIRIQGNYVGVTPGGGNIGNFGNGIEINKVTDFLVGGSSSSERNYIGFNKFATDLPGWAGGGIMVNNGSINGVIQGNYVGLAPDGTSNAGNTNNSTINPSNPGQNAGITCEFSSNIRINNNTVRFNNYGIRFSNGAGGAPTGNTVVSNNITGNTIHGVFLTGGTNNIFGSATTTAEGNTINNNGGDGIHVLNTATTENQFRRNSISCNTGMGINLNYGANQGNRGKASPVIDINSIGTVTLRGTAQANDIIDIFGNTACLRTCEDPLKRQGQTYLATVTADASGNWSWTHNDPSLANVSATATGVCTGGNCNTSEFNTCDSFCEDAVAPTSVASDKNNFCSDDAGNITLTATGGSGETLNWYTSSCGGTLVGTGNPLVIASPSVTTTYYARWETTGCANSTCASTTVTVNPVTQNPTSASPDRNNFCSDDAGNITLSATGGSGATLSWYTESCGGTLIGTGNNLVIASPTATTTYYVRWETPGCTPSGCASTTVTVNPVTVAPTSVTSDKNNFCSDDAGNITLTATGGSGQTLNWYTSSCGGTLVGTGNPLVIASPAVTTTYYARWETTGCANSTCASTTVTVNPVTQDPTSATPDRNNFCSDDSGNITLTANGGSGATLTWYTGSCGGTQIGTGNNLVIASPTATTTYYVRWETPGCTPSGCASTTVTVNPVTVAPTAIVSDKNNFCSDDAGNITLTAAGGSGQTLNWYTSSCGGTLVGTGSPLVIASPAVTTTYFARWETTGCTESSCASTTVTVNPVTQDPTSASPDRNNFCSDDAGNITLTADAGSGVTLSWYTGSCGGTLVGTGNNLVIPSPTATTTYYVRWETPGCTPSGCASTTVTVNPVTVAPTSVISDKNNFCSDDAGNITLTATGGSGETLNWYTSSCGGTLVGTGNPLIIASPSVTTTYYARWETTGCTESSCANTTVTVNPVTQDPTSATPDRNNFCSDDAGNITLTANGGSGETLTWYTGSCGGTQIGTGNDLVIASPTVTTTYYVRWETPGCTPSGCVSTTVTVNPVTVAPTSASVDRNNFCSSDAGTIELSVVGGSGAVLNWYTESCGGTLVGTGNPLVIESPTSDVTYFARWETPGCAASNCASVSVTVDPGTTDPVTIGVDRNNLCVDDAGDIILTATGGAGGTMVWYEGGCGVNLPIGSGGDITIPSPTVTTTYFVRWESSSGDCANSNCLSTQVVVTPVTKPEIDTIGPAEFCEGGSVELQAKTFEAGVSYNYQWYKDGVAIDGATSDTYVADTTGNYTVIVTHPTSLCVSDESDVVAVKSNFTQSAQLSISDPAEFCYGNGNSLLITATSPDPDVTYQWYKDGILVLSGSSNTYTADTSGTYSVVLVHNTTSCTSGTSNEIDVISHVTSQPEIDVDDPTKFCSDQSALLTAILKDFSGNVDEKNYTFQWYKDGGIINDATSKTYIANESGNYTVRVTNTNTTCTSTDSEDVGITVNQKPAASIAGKNLICTNETTTLTATPASGVTYQWYFEGALMADSTNATYTTGIGGVYRVVVETPEGCSDDETYQITVNPAVASINLDGPGEFCEGGTVQLTASPSGGTYEWSNGSTDPFINTNTSGTYWVKVTIGDCVALPSDTIIINVKPNPTVDVSPSDSSICYGAPVKLTATPTGGNGTYTYVWTNSLNEIVAGDTSSYETKVGGIFTVTVNSDGCTSSDFATIKVVSPNVDAGGDSITSTLSACFGFPVDIKAELYNSTANTIHWWKSGNPVSLLEYLHEETVLDPTFVAPAAGEYKYYLFAQEPNTGCEAIMDSVNIKIHSLPSVVAMAGKNPVCIGSEAELFVNPLSLSEKYTYFWYKDGESEPFVSGDSVKSIVFNATNNFMVVAVDSNFCMDTVDVVVSAIENQNLVIPNLLTPNGDGYNDTFLIMDDVGRALLPGAKLDVYNRWGTRVFRTIDYDNNWTPDIVDGVYFYDLTPGCGDGVKRGWLHIINNEGNVGRTE